MTRTQLSEWQDLAEHRKMLGKNSIKQLFDDNPRRFEEFHLEHDGMLFDYSKQAVTNETLQKLVALARACDIEEWREKMFSGAVLNQTENRAVLHTALRAQDDTPVIVDGEDVRPKIKDVLTRMKNLSDKVRREKKYTHIVNIGIGGSDLGAAMVHEALKPFVDRNINLHFVSNVDGTHLSEVLRVIDPQKSLFIVTSKSFTTQDTITNAISAKEWLQEQLGQQDVSEHFIATSQNIEAAKSFGVKEENIYPIWDWVGGRFSLWSSVGLPFCIALGYDNFNELLCGAHEMDQHFLNAPLDQNMPILLAMLGIWNRNFLGYNALSIISYDQYLRYFPAYMQQLDMESNGKAVDRDNNRVDYSTSPIIIGETGTNAQHAFFQLVHQGTTIIPCDFILVAKTQNPLGDHHKKLLSNALAQTKALMEGMENQNPHKSFDGNRPTSTLILNELTPHALGSLLALYEHKIFIQGIIWNLNSFDQCGVELGKVLANQIIEDYDKDIDHIDTDASTRGILRYIKNIS